MSLVGKKVLFKNEKVDTPTWGTVLDKVLTPTRLNTSMDMYLVQAIVTIKQTSTRTSDEEMVFLLNPEHIELVEHASEKKNL